MNERLVGRSDLERLRLSGLLDGQAFAQAAFLARDRGFWARWAGYALLALGAGHFLAGLVFFFAFNWDEMSRWQKFGLLEGVILLAAIGGLLLGQARILGQVFLIAASVATGVLLAVVGQVYQTGADAYELFAAWALLILPWVLLSRSAPHWVLWGVVIYTALVTYAEQALLPVNAVTFDSALLLWAAVPGLLLLGYEAGRSVGRSWLSALWPRYLALLVLFGHLLLAAGRFVFEDPAYFLSARGPGPGFLLFLLCCGLCWRFYAWRLKDLAASTIVFLALGFFAGSLGARFIDLGIDDWRFDHGAGLLSWSLLVVWSFLCLAAFAWLLRRQQRAMRESSP